MSAPTLAELQAAFSDELRGLLTRAIFEAEVYLEKQGGRRALSPESSARLGLAILEQMTAGRDLLRKIHDFMAGSVTVANGGNGQATKPLTQVIR